MKIKSRSGRVEVHIDHESKDDIETLAWKFVVYAIEKSLKFSRPGLLILKVFNQGAKVQEGLKRGFPEADAFWCTEAELIKELENPDNMADQAYRNNEIL